jgi:single-stranded-DNA-specific exonuclease
VQAPRGLRSRTIGAYLDERGIAPGPGRDAFLHPRLASLTPPAGMADRELAAQRLATAIRKNEPVVVFGDYDCDGMTATAILAGGLRRLGAHVTTCLASRFDGGYGVSPQALARIEASAPGLVVTCDCGSSDHQAIAALQGAGVDVIVVDHHLVPSEPLPALAFLNPHRPDCPFPFKWLASCGLVMSLLGQVRAELGRPLDLRDYLDLVAIGTVADVAPLEGDNRTLVRAGLERLAKPERPGLRALLELLGVTGEFPVTASDIAFRIAPRLNAPGRLGAPDLALDLLLAESLTDARILAERLDQASSQRRAVQLEIEEQARALALAEAADGCAALVLGQADWNHGIVGIVAGRLADEFGLPTMVIGFEGDVGRGSVRGPAGFPLYDAVSACAEHLVRFGGHQAAAGVTVERRALAELRVAFDAACRAQRDRVETKAAPPGLTLHPDDSLADVLADLWLLEPCGAQNPLPALEVEGTVREARSVRGGHLKLSLSLASGATLQAFGPNLGQRGADLRGQVRVSGELRPDRHRGGDAVELLIRNLVS